MESLQAQPVASLPIGEQDENLTATNGSLYPPQIRHSYTPPPQKENAGFDREREESSPSHGRKDSGPNGHTYSERNTVESLGVCASPSSEYVAPRNSKSKREQAVTQDRARSEAQSLATMLQRGIVDHQFGLSVNLVLFVAMSYVLFPSLRDSLSAVFWLSYGMKQQTGATETWMYGQGLRDAYLVASLIVVFTGLRAFMLDYVLMPLAGLCGIRKRKGRVRFAEQSYLILYYGTYWTWGVYLFVRDTPLTLPPGSSISFNSILISLWTAFPRLVLDAQMKFYYLSQTAFWIQQILVIHLEEKRKDHYQMLTHHFFTVALLATSYGYRQWRVGNAVLACMDVVDVIFPTAKILKYIGWQAACDAMFALFVILWIVARHFGYLSICWSIYAHVNEVAMPYGVYSLRQISNEAPYNEGTHVVGARISGDGGDQVIENLFQPFLNPTAETVSFNANIRWGFLGLLLGLQCITILWLFMICRVVIRVLQGQGADDTRSDDEGEDESEDITDELSEKGSGPVQPSMPFTVDAKPRFIEVEASSSDYMPSRHTSTASRSGSKRKSKGGAFSSGLNLGERKDILNRIGCLSEEQLAREREKREGGDGVRPGSSASGGRR